jgi:membrane protein implicated in regulation of membrane protease activity
MIFWVWVILAAFFIVAEIFTAGFFLLFFGIGAAIAAILAFFNVGVAWQLFVFIVVSFVLFLLSRKIADRVTPESPIKTGIDRLLGQIGVVMEDIEPMGVKGRVRIAREEWRAECEADVKIKRGKKVKVLRIEGTRVIVEPIED